MLTECRKLITIGPKYFPADMCPEDDESTDDEEKVDCNTQEPNSACKCTVIKGPANKNTTNKHVNGAAANNIK